MAEQSYVSMVAEARRLRIVSVATDWFSTSVAWLLFDVARFGLLSVGYATLGGFLLAQKVMAGQILFPVAMLGVYWLSGYYNNPLRRSRLSELGMTAVSALAGTLGVLLLMLLNDLTDALTDDYLLLCTLFGLLLVIVYVPRSVITTVVLHRFSDGRLAWRAAMVTDDAYGEASGNLIARITSHTSVVPVMKCGASDALKAAHEGLIDCFVLLPTPSNRLEDLMPALAVLLGANKPVFLSPMLENIVERRYGQVGIGSGRRNLTESIYEEPLMDLSRTEMSATTLNFKRLSDIVVGCLAMVATSPLVLILALLVRITSPGPAFYRQRRVGYHRKPFDIIKLRTMRADAEVDTGPVLTREDDQRVTPLGRIMRKYRLDELPQFFNVVKGDMSLVGPRPERPYFVDRIVAVAPFYTLVHQVRPGITSWGMVKYGYASTIEEMVERLRYDLLYLENIGFTVDMKIIIHTIRIIAAGKGL
ncbi:MAG: exopolysaccharide biosynthesis polyprenyl glycosylphosphotransferase [Bacteroides sp.]|nr:exopolysaccharide biosynthesis polyprenyl glycosylphosphotransferase [Bacteroides sp.]